MHETLPIAPHLPAASLEALKSALGACGTLVEYGAGGSTVLAAASGVRRIISIESSVQWIAKVREALDSLKAKAEVHLLHGNLGVTGDWGRPTTQDTIAQWHQYAMQPWATLDQLGGEADLVFIDGRFRVACFCASMISARPGTRILFDDYSERPHYHVVEELAKRHEVFDRMAEFRVPATLDHRHALALLMRFVHNVD